MVIAKNISDNGVSRVDLLDGFAYKRQPKFLTDNEFWCLQEMYPSGFVPKVEQVEMELLKIEWIVREQVTDKKIFMGYLPQVLKALRKAGIRHGDLTEYSVLVKDNKPMLIDFAESRLWKDPRPDKRRSGDTYWLRSTMELYCGGP